MSDLFSPFHDAEQLPSPAPEDVRRRGDALRRRRQALQAGGAAAVVTVVALGAVGLSGGFADRSTQPPVMTQPTAPATSTAPPSRITQIPASLDLARGWVDGDGKGEEENLRSGPQVQWLGDVTECAASHSPADESSDHTAALYTQPDLTQARDLRVLVDDATARRVAEDYVSWFRDCPRFSLDGAASETRNQVSDLQLGDQSWLVSQTYWTDDVPQLAENVLVVVRVGNTILVTQRYGESPGATDPAASQRVHGELVDEVDPIVAEVECAVGGAC